MGIENIYKPEISTLKRKKIQAERRECEREKNKHCQSGPHLNGLPDDSLRSYEGGSADRPVQGYKIMHGVCRNWLENSRASHRAYQGSGPLSRPEPHF